MTVLPVVLLGAAYLAAVRRYDATHPGTPLPRSWVLSFGAGLVLLGIAVSEPLDALAHQRFSLHMLQHVILTMAAPPLLLLGRPGLVARRTLSGRAGRGLVTVLRSRPVRIGTHPALAWALFATVLWATHFTPLYQRALESAPVHLAEHGLYLSAAILFWFPVVGVEPARHRLGEPGRILYLFLASAGSGLLASTLYQSGRVLYPAYADAGLSGQRAGGAVMWIGGGLLFLLAALLVAARWARRERRGTAAVGGPYSRAMPITPHEKRATAGSRSHTP